MTNAVVLAIF